MERAEWLVLAPQEQAKLFLEAVDEVLGGQPGRFMETFLLVENKSPEQLGGVVQMRFVENQRYYYETCFKGRRDIMEPIYAVGDKARQAYHSVFWLGAGFSNFWCSAGGWNIALFAHHDKTLKQYMSYIDIMEEGIPEYLKTGWRKSYWRDDHKEVKFPNGAINRIDIYSGESNTVPRGGRYQMALYSEGAHYREGYWQRVSTAMRGVQPVWEIWDSTRNGTTYAETGAPNQHYVKVKALEEGSRKGYLLRRFWYHDPANTMPPGSPLARPGTEGDFPLTEEEQAIAREIAVAPGKSLTDYFRWRRAEIAAYIDDKGGNEKRGKAFFLQENLENAGHWANAEKTPFDLDIVQRYLNVNERPWREERRANGMLIQFAQGAAPGHDYAAGQDCAAGRLDGDLDSVSLVDALDGNSRLHVGRLIGKVGSLPMAEGAMGLLREYHDAYWGIEVNGGWGDNAVKAAIAAYDRKRLYKRPMNNGETPERYAVDADYGFLTTKASKERIIQGLIDDFNAGRFKTFFKDTLHMLMNYDPDSLAHTPDEMMSLAIANEVAKDRRVWRERNLARVAMNANGTVRFIGYGPRMAAPFRVA